MATTYYVDGAVGDDSNTGLAEGAGNALATINAAAAKFTALDGGSIIYIKNSVTYSEAVTSTTYCYGQTANPFTVEGYSSTPGDGGMVIIDGNNTLTDFWYYGLYNGNIFFKNLEVRNFTDNGFEMGNSDTNHWFNCKIHDNGDRGIWADNYNTISYCEIYNNATAGTWFDQYGSYYNSKIYNNGGSYQARCAGYVHTFKNCVIAGSSTYLIYGPVAPVIIDCTLDGMGTAHGYTSTALYYSCLIANNIFHDCNIAINAPTTAYTCSSNGGGNFFSSCTAAYSSGWPDHAKIGDTTGSAAFTDEANMDYTLASGSDAIGAGYGLDGADGSWDNGAYPTIPAAPGGGGRIVLIG